MAQSHEMGNPIVTADNPLIDLLGWARLVQIGRSNARRSNCSPPIATHRSEAVEFVLDADAPIDRQSRRLLRPLLACLATISTAEAGTPPHLYGGQLSFKRPDPEGRVWILGQFDNRPGTVRVAFRRAGAPPEALDPGTAQCSVPTAGSRPDAPQPKTSTPMPADELAT
jgi:hypothetical protein